MAEAHYLAKQITLYRTQDDKRLRVFSDALTKERLQAANLLMALLAYWSLLNPWRQ